jgi:hypothetical protein
MKHRWVKDWSGKDNNYTAGLDLWQWGIPFSVTVEKEWVEVRILCFIFVVAWK